MSAWNYLENIYKADSLFAVQETPKLAIQNEIERINFEDSTFIANLPTDSFVRWYLPVRKLVNSVPVVAQYRTHEISETIEAFRQLDYTDERLYKSGLLEDVFESDVWLIENSGHSLDSVFVKLNKSIDGMIDNLSGEKEKLNEIAGYLFDLLESRSMFQSSEYLALSLLNNQSALLYSRLANKLEIYRAMKIGNTVPDIVFSEANYDPDNRNAGRLSELQSDYTLVVFTASWCAQCREMITELKAIYDGWKNQGVEVVLISLDETPNDFKKFVSGLPIISTSDYQKWDSPIAEDYYVHSIPAMVLLNSERALLHHPNSVWYMDAWVYWYLVLGNR